MDIPRDGWKFRNRCSSVYSIGSMEPEELDSGPDFYAPQTMEAPDGRRILVAWMQNWDRSMPTQELGQGWAGSMTIPRELALRDGALFQWPVRELESLRRNRREYSARIGGGGNGADEVDLSRDQGAEGSEARAPEPRVTGKPEGHCLDLEIQFTSLGALSFGIEFFRQGGRSGGRSDGPGGAKTVLSYSTADGTLTLDRSRSGLEIRSLPPGRPDCNICGCHVDMVDSGLTLRILLDRSSCEVFASGGRRTLSATVYPPEGGDGIEFFAQGGDVLVRCVAWDLSTSEHG